MADISVIIIAKNEESKIEECMKSISWADEIILVDGFSEDATVSITRKYTDKIYQRQWDGYGSQKQFALEKATGEWILSIDADERVTPELKTEILEFIKSPKQGISGFNIPYKFYFLGHLMRYGGCSHEKHLRFFRRSGSRFTQDSVHEGVYVQGRISTFKNHIIHNSYKDIDEYFKKFNLYTSLDAEKKFARGKRISVWRFLIFKWEFVNRYIFKLGFLDGVYGLLWALFSSFYALVKYAKLWERQKNK